MPLPEANTTWPPLDWAKAYDRYYEHSAWYSGSSAQISSYYQTRLERMFWAQQIVEGERKTMMHVPVPGDIAATSASMLFSEHPQFKIPTEGNVKTADRLADIVNEGGVYNRLLEGAEVCSALGGIFLKVNWDAELSAFPMLSICDPDNALPEFRHGQLVAVTFWKVIYSGDGYTKDYVRWLERHEPGVILNGLYRGSLTNLGAPISLDSYPETKGLQPITPTGLKGLACRYVPNMKPNRWLRSDPKGAPLGRSDYAGAEGIYDSIDRVWSSLIRDIELGLGRVIAPAEYFEKSSTDGQFRFDPFKEAYLSLNTPISGEPTNNITLSQFAIRTTEHLTSLKDLYVQAYTAAGYSPQSFGMDIQGQAESGTALRIREGKSFKTTAKKGEYWTTPIADILEIMLMVDRLHLGNNSILPERPNVVLEDGIKADPKEIAESVELWNRANAACTLTKVATLHPDWTADQCLKEAQEILKETGMAVPNPNLEDEV